jgi:hypothetical protein
MRTDEYCQEFLKSEFALLSIQAAFQRSGVYAKGVEDRKKMELRSYFKQRIEEISREYVHPVEGSNHERNIEVLTREITERFREILKDHNFRIGITQKALNLYLKYLWCERKIAIPPHCPFDRKIIELLPKDIRLNWTQIDNIEKYRKLVVAACKEATSEPIAVWELRNYQNIK